jgi:hypothetical protein
MVDKDTNFIAVSLFNVAEGGIKVNDWITILDPTVEDISVTLPNKTQKLAYSCIHVNFVKVLINGKQPDKSLFSETVVALETVGILRLCNSDA